MGAQIRFRRAAALLGVLVGSAFSASVGLGGPVSNISVVPDYDKYAVTYDLKNGGPCPVFLMGSTDGGKTFDLQMEYVQGDVGPSVAPGKKKRILWDARKDFPDNLDSLDLTLDVVAVCPPPAPREAAAPVAPVRTAAEFLADLRAEIAETEELLAEKKQELEDLGHEGGDLREKGRDLSSEMNQIKTQKLVKKTVSGLNGRDVQITQIQADSGGQRKYEKKANEKEKVFDQLDSNRARQDKVRKLIREYEKKLEDLRKEEREAARGGK